MRTRQERPGSGRTGGPLTLVVLGLLVVVASLGCGGRAPVSQESHPMADNRASSAAAESHPASASGSSSQGGASTPDPRAAPPATGSTTTPTAIATAAPAATRGAAALPPRTPSPQAAGPVVRAAHGWAEEEAHVCRPGEAFGRWARQDFVGWSPDGATILFSRGPELYGVTAEGTRIWPVADAGTSTVLGEAGTTISFAVSPDGTRVVFATCRYGKPSPEIRRTNGGWPTRVWRLGYELAVVGIDGTDPQRLTTNALELDSFPAWAPDGRRISTLR